MTATKKKKKDGKLANHGRKGYNALVQKLGSPEAVKRHYAKIAKARWSKHPEQRSAEHKAKAAAKAKAKKR